jgi:hypothetical protein
MRATAAASSRSSRPVAETGFDFGDVVIGAGVLAG